MEGINIPGLPPSPRTAKDATPAGFGASMLDYEGSGRDSKAQYAKQEPRKSLLDMANQRQATKVKTPMLDAFNADTAARRGVAQRVDPMEVQNEMLFGQWPQKQKQVVEDTSAAVAALTHPLQLVEVSAGDPSVATIRVRYGTVGGVKADTDMEPDDDPVFSFSISGAAVTKYIYCTVTVEYDTATGIWSQSATVPEIAAANSLPAATATTLIVQIGTADVASDGDGGYVISSITQTVSGNQWIARTGNGTTYVDANGLI